MVFQTPIWLWGLLPWAAVVIYLMIGRGRLAMVPFLRFWESSATLAPRRSLRRPPLFIALVLSAMLLAIICAAQPAWRGHAAALSNATIVLDCGSTMARPAVDGKAFRGVLNRCAQIIGPIAGRVEVNPVPGQRVECSGADWTATAARLSATAIAVDLDDTIRGRLRQTNGPLIVLSDQHLNISDSRIVQVSPEPPAPTVAITLLAAVAQPRPQVMIRLENHSSRRSVHLRVTSGDARVERQIALKPANSVQNEFIDLPKLDEAITAEIVDAAPGDPWSKAYLARQNAGVQIIAIGDLPESVRRMIAVYAKDRPAQADAQPLIVTDHPLGEQQAGIWLDATAPVLKADRATVVPSPLTRDVQSWPETDRQTAPLPTNFAPAVSVDGFTIVAVREGPSRQVLLRGSLNEWAKSPDFVVFFSNAFAWIAGDDPQYASIAPALLGDQWKAVDDASHAAGAWPGIYRSPAGMVTAVNAGAYPTADDAVSPARVPMGLAQQSDRSLTAAAVVIALACLLAAACIWPTGITRKTAGDSD